jgi:hypothetical protein
MRENAEKLSVIKVMTDTNSGKRSQPFRHSNRFTNHHNKRVKEIISPTNKKEA